MTLMYHALNRTDDLDLANSPKSFIEFNSRRMSCFNKVLQCIAIIVNNDVWCQINVNGYCSVTYKGL